MLIFVLPIDEKIRVIIVRRLRTNAGRSLENHVLSEILFRSDWAACRVAVAVCAAWIGRAVDVLEQEEPSVAEPFHRCFQLVIIVIVRGSENAFNASSANRIVSPYCLSRLTRNHTIQAEIVRRSSRLN